MTKNKSEGDYLDHRAIIDEFLAPFKVYLDSDLTEICVNRPGEVWTESARRDLSALPPLRPANRHL